MILACMLALLLPAGCSTEAEPLSPIDRCTEPAAATLGAASDYPLELTPNPVPAGSVATLAITYSGDGDLVGGAGAVWECWTGEQWERTHQVMRGVWNDGPATNYIEPDTTVTVPAIGLEVPNSYAVAIPDVSPGVYRISDEAWLAGERWIGLVIVTVE